MKPHRSPNFFCVGAGKSGTTSVYSYLREHPEVFLPVRKELHYLAWHTLERFSEGPGVKHSRSDWCKTEPEYLSQFRKANREQVVGDFSPSYLHEHGTAQRIKKFSPDAKILIMLRNPVDKVISQFGHLKRDGRENLSIKNAFDAEDDRIDSRWGAIFHYKRTSLYASDVQEYIDVFGKEAVRIYLFEDLVQDSNALIRSLCNFLEIDCEIQLNVDRVYNRSGTPRSKIIASALGPTWLNSQVKKVIPRDIGRWIKSTLLGLNMGKKIDVDAEIRTYLRQHFDEDIRNTERIIGRSTGW